MCEGYQVVNLFIDSIFNINNFVFFSVDFNDLEISFFKVMVMYDGNVMWVVFMVIMSFCKINVLNFLLDEQVGDVMVFFIYFIFEYNNKLL